MNQATAQRNSKSRDPAEEPEFAVSLINRVVVGVDDLRLGLHVCRGNWSRDETTLLSGGYQSLRTYLDRLQITQLVLEYATERAGTLVGFEGKELGLASSILAPTRSRRRSRFVRPSKRRSVSIPPNACS